MNIKSSNSLTDRSDFFRNTDLTPNTSANLSINPFQKIFQNPVTPETPWKPKKKWLMVTPKKIERANKKSRKLANFVMKNLSPEMGEHVKKLYSDFGALVKEYNLTAEDFDHLFEATPDARSTYSWKYVPNKENRLKKMQKLRSFLINATNNQFPETFDKNLEKHAMNLEALMTALGYRAIGPGWINNTTRASSGLKNLLEKMSAENYIVPAFSEIPHSFPTRGKEDLASKEKKAKIMSLKDAFLKDKFRKYPLSKIGLHIPQREQEPLPGKNLPPKPGLKSRNFKLNSFVYKGLKEGVPMRAHASGSAPLTLAAMDFVSTRGKLSKTFDEKAFQMHAGLISATYEAGDYHSFAETAAGISFYRKFRSF